eukprot:CAMPEP_0195290082 /NCGR_PEP_ID=MMETSP0707-20130614/6090_1 /TAXON_ID=33640 /ORGANISM="Asterionellopsis glacialis, Strain CCMP134" /LENGTH=170 /DNA_ID=CAMNT_0040350159 /DNA_START=549 /DNA_END=1058 /DNA_ORIENTATION=-
MAAHGEGGWMSDYDTFPLGITPHMGSHLPNQGRFTSYARHVPALLSGSAAEWNRLTQELFHMAIAVEPEDLLKPNFYSDMHALKDLHDRYPSILDYGILGGGHEILVTTYPYAKENKVDCEMLQHEGILAAHLSHAATRQASEEGVLYIPKGRTEKDRHFFAKMLVRYWR